MSKIFEPINTGANTFANRIWMAPLTRCRADIKTFVPTDIMKEYYTQRASAGLIITEFTTVTENAITFNSEAGIYNDAQAAGWKKVVDSVHEAGGKIFCQIAHGGRAAHANNNGGKAPVAPSAMALTEHQCAAEFNASGEKIPYSKPVALTDEEAQAIVKDFAAAAKRAVHDAGFDGVEVHGANGYLIDEFLCAASNKRETGRYAGTSMETRSQFMRDVLEAVIKEVGAGKVGIRISPLNSYNEMTRINEEKAQEEVRFVSNMLNELGVAYLHVMRADFFSVQTGDVITPARETFKGTLLVNMGYDDKEAEEGIAAGKFDAVAFGTKFLANPDLPARFKTGAELTQPDPNTFYTKDTKGFIDYPTMAN